MAHYPRRKVKSLTTVPASLHHPLRGPAPALRHEVRPHAAVERAQPDLVALLLVLARDELLPARGLPSSTTVALIFAQHAGSTTSMSAGMVMTGGWLSLPFLLFPSS
jgi:hypothetical protein